MPRMPEFSNPPIVIDVKGSKFKPRPSKGTTYSDNDHRLIGVFYVMYTPKYLRALKNGAYTFNAEWDRVENKIMNVHFHYAD